MSFEEKVQEYIDSIKNDKLDDPNLVFSDGTSQHEFYKKLCDEHYKISTVTNPTPQEQIKKYFYHEIKRVLKEEESRKKKLLKEQELERIQEEKIEKEEEKIIELLEAIDEFKGLPPKMDKDGNKYTFSDGTYYYNYYKRLEKFYFDNLDKCAFSGEDFTKIEGYTRISRALDEYEVLEVKDELLELKEEIKNIGNNNPYLKKSNFFEGYEEAGKKYKTLRLKYAKAKVKKNTTREEKYILEHFLEIEIW